MPAEGCNIIQAAVKYFISILVGTTYLARLCLDIGISDSITGVLNAFISLGFGFQFFALFISGRTGGSKRIVTLLAVVNQAAFSFLYLIPVFDIPKNAKTAIFVVLLLLAEVVKNIAFPLQSTWFISLVDDKKRGVFIAKKEIISLISGMIVSMIMGRVIDSFEAKGELRTAFIIGGITLFALTAIHTALLIMIKEKPQDKQAKPPKVKLMLKDTFSDKNLLLLIPLFIFWNMAVYSTVPFYATYQINELGFTMTFVAVQAIVYAVTRSLISIPIGKLADKYSFTTMLTVCYSLAAMGYVPAVFMKPGNGHLLYTLYHALYAMSMAGINGGSSNLVYDYVPYSRRTGSLAVKNTFAGFAGFLTTLAFSPLIDKIQKANNTFMGMENVYAQQVVSVFGLVMVLVCIAYLNIVIKPLHKPADHIPPLDPEEIAKDDIPKSAITPEQAPVEKQAEA